MQVDLPIVVSLLTAALTAGAALSRLGAHSERLKTLEKFRERAGARIERLEATERERRRALTQGNPVVDAGGRVIATVPDDSSE